MAEATVTILGGLPVIAVCIFGKDADTPNGPGEYWGEVDALYWIKSDGSKGKEVSQKVYDRLEKADPYWQADVTESVSDQLAYEDSLRRKEAGEPEFFVFGTAEEAAGAGPVQPVGEGEADQTQEKAQP